MCREAWGRIVPSLRERGAGAMLAPLSRLLPRERSDLLFPGRMLPEADDTLDAYWRMGLVDRRRRSSRGSSAPMAVSR